MSYVAPILIGVLYALAMSAIPEPHRRRFNAVMVAGAGAAYLSGGGNLQLSPSSRGRPATTPLVTASQPSTASRGTRIRCRTMPAQPMRRCPELSVAAVPLLLPYPGGSDRNTELLCAGQELGTEWIRIIESSTSRCSNPSSHG
ncbi:DUF6010 family protein [Nocardia arthritidis]|uniref:DUF6010 family protein n=1 Tax=Nocardia arthritidis TaxID=228602 RepID=UPI0009FF86AB|nr:DUF6010 family protein [Nocardia arthritidis]